MLLLHAGDPEFSVEFEAIEDALYQKFINALTSEAKLPSARRVVQADWDRPELSTWRGRILEEVEQAARPAILVAHSLATVHAAPLFARDANGCKVKGGFLVAPPSSAGLSRLDELDPAFVTLPGEPLSFPTVLVASRDDKYSSFADSETLAKVLGRKTCRRWIFGSHQQAGMARGRKV